jgi:DNA-binding GntR family transcriptional regulator
MHARVGWSVRPYDFRQFEDFYDLRLILERRQSRACAACLSEHRSTH